MLTYPDISPVAVSFGPVAIHWYGLMYLVGFVGSWWMGVVRARKPGSGWKAEEIGDLIFYGALGVILGGRVGYILFYNFGACFSTIRCCCSASGRAACRSTVACSAC